MNFIRFVFENKPTFGLVDGNKVRRIEGDPFFGYQPTGKELALDSIRLLSPCTPSKIVAVGVNYRDHAAEFDRELPKEPLLFLKPSTSVLGPNETIQLPRQSKRVDFEAELAVVIRKEASGIPEEAAYDYILGYTCLNDVSARDLQKKDGQWTRAKSFNTFAPLGPWIVTDIDPGNLKIKSYLNGERRQSANTNQLLFKVSTLVSFISQVMTLLPGDVIATGTPAGVGPMKPNDTIEIVIDNIGRLTNSVK